MSKAAWPDEKWAVLGEKIAEARRAKGWDQQRLAELSGNSATTISNYERGRPARTLRIPSGLVRVAHALGWPPEAVRKILDGEDPEMILGQAALFTVREKSERDTPGKPPGLLATHAPVPQVSLFGTRNPELTESGYLAQDTFIRQAKRYRKLKGISLEQVAKAIAELQGVHPPGGNLEVVELESLENGTRLLKGAEAELIATALGTTVSWLLGSGFSVDAPDELKAPPTDEELQAEAKAVERRIGEMGTQVNGAAAQAAHFREREAEARRQAEWAQAILESATAQQHELMRQYQYLLGRIDSLRAAKGEELIIQVHRVYVEDDVEE